MATTYTRGAVGDTPDPVTGVATICGEDITTDQGDDATLDLNDPLTPSLTLDGAFVSTFLNAGDSAALAGRVVLSGDFNDYCLNLDGIQGGVNIGQWAGQPAAVVRAFKKFADTVAHNATIGAPYWVDLGANGAYTMLCDGSDGKVDLRDATTPGISVSRVVFNRNSAANFDATGRPKSNFKIGSSAANVSGTAQGAQGAFWVDTSTGLVTVRFPTGMDPTTSGGNGLEYALKGKTALYYSSVGGVFTWVNPIISDLTLEGWGDVASTAPHGTAINMSFTQGAVVRNCRVLEGGDHHIAFGSKVDNATITGCTLIGGEVGCYYVVFNASGVGQTASGTFSDSTIEAFGLLGHDGLKIGGTTGSVGCYIHGPHNNIVVRRVTMNVYDPATGAPDSFIPVDSDDGVLPSDPTRATNYPVLVDRLIVNKSTEWFSQGVTSYIGFLNCTVYGTQVNETYQVGLLACNARKGRWHWEGCGLAANLANPNGAASIAMVDVGAGHTVSALNTTFRDTATSHSNNKIAFFNRRVGTKTIDQITTGAAPVIRTTAAHGYVVGTNVVISSTNSTPVIDGVFKVATVPNTTHFTLVAVAGGTASVPTVTVAGTSGSVGGYGNIVMRGCLFSYDGAGQASRTFRAVNGDSACPIGVDFQDCAFWGVTTDQWSENSSFNSDAEWAAAMPGTVVLAADPFAGVAAGSIEPTAAFRSIQKAIAPHTTVGFNGRPYGRQYGGAQYGSSSSGGPGRLGARSDARGVGRLTRLTR